MPSHLMMMVMMKLTEMMRHVMGVGVVAVVVQLIGRLRPARGPGLGVRFGRIAVVVVRLRRGSPSRVTLSARSAILALFRRLEKRERESFGGKVVSEEGRTVLVGIVTDESLNDGGVERKAMKWDRTQVKR